ncbi:FdhF/YdeP family oxidoreductase [soil metagenome]
MKDLEVKKNAGPLIETPVENTAPRITAPSTTAAGLTAVISSMKHALREMSVVNTVKTLGSMNQKDGFDCPSCAWPDPDDRRALAEFCENGAKAVSDEATAKRVTPEFFKEHSVLELSQQSDFELGQHGRFTHPMILKPGATHYQPIEWDQAFDLIAENLNSLETPNEAAFYTSGRTSNEAAFMYQLFARIFGTNNLPDCSNMCHESSGSALGEQIGIGKGTVTLEDIHQADCIMILGQNPGTNHPRMLTALQVAVRNGCQIISINPLKEAGMGEFLNPQELGGMLGVGTPIAKLHLPVRINGDVALMKGLMKEMLASEVQHGPGTVFDLEFIHNSTVGFDDLISDVRKADWIEIVRESGVSREKIRQAADILVRSKRTIACWAMGLTQHKNAVGNIQMVTNVLLLRGNIGRTGAGPCPVRGHSNVQGDRTMGIFEKVDESFLVAIDKEFKISAPRKHGFDTVDTIKAMQDGRVKVFFGLGGNFLAATPDTQFTAEALKKCKLTVQVSTKPNRSHLITGTTALILPCLGRTEIDTQATGPQFVTVEDSMGVVHASHGTLKAGSPHLKSEVAIVCGLAQAVFKNQPQKLGVTDWSNLINNYDLIRDHIARVVAGFNDFNVRVRRPGGFYLPNGPRDGRIFDTPTKRASFLAHPIAKTHHEEGHLTLMTIRSHDQFNTTIYGLDDRYRGVKQGRRVIFLNEVDMKKQSLEAGAYVDITSHFEGVTRLAPHFMVVPYEIPQQCAAVYYPEGNVLVPITSVADRSNTPAYKSVEISLAPSVRP